MSVLRLKSDPNLLAPSRLGSVLRGKWRLDAVLGVGGMGTIYAATHRNASRAAIKILHPSEDPQVLDRFLREGYAANRVDHPGVVKVLDEDVTEDGQPFLVMELLDGETLDQIVARSGPLGISPAADVIDQVLDVLSAAHARGIVHRDVKPENVLVTRTGQVKILDFGIARVAQPTGATHAGLVMGTPAFMSPEQARGRWDDVDAQSDLFSLAATFFMIVTGRRVREADTANEALLLAMCERLPAVRVLAPELPLEIAAVMDRALAFDKKDRWASADAMRSALRETIPALAPTLVDKVSPSDTVRMPVARTTVRAVTPANVVTAIRRVARPPMAKLRIAAEAARDALARFRRAPPADRASLAVVAAGLIGALALVLVALTIRASRPPERLAAADPRERAPRAALVPARTAESRVEAPAASAPETPSARPTRARSILDRRF